MSKEVPDTEDKVVPFDPEAVDFVKGGYAINVYLNSVEQTDEEGGYLEEQEIVSNGEEFATLYDAVHQGLSSVSWLEWSEYPPRPGAWIVSEEALEDYRTSRYTSYVAIIQHSDRKGTPLTLEEMRYIHQQLRLYGTIQ